MQVVAGPSGSGKSSLLPVAAAGIDHFNIDDRCAQLSQGTYVGIKPEIRARANAECEAFIAQHIESLAQMEAVLSMRQDPSRQWDAGELAQKLYITADMCTAMVADLERRGFVRRVDESDRYRYHAADADADRLLGDLGKLYQERRVAVITEIYSKPVNKVQTFADAFRLRREE